jgi:hypothetical protein
MACERYHRTAQSFPAQEKRAIDSLDNVSREELGTESRLERLLILMPTLASVAFIGAVLVGTQVISCNY